MILRRRFTCVLHKVGRSYTKHVSDKAQGERQLAASFVVFTYPPATPQTPNVLLIKRKNSPAKNLWSLPGGRFEPGETILQCAKRELQEETGVDPRTVKLSPTPFTTSEFMKEGFHYVILIMYGVLPYEYSESVVAGDDASGIGWCPVSVIEQRAELQKHADHTYNTYRFYEDGKCDPKYSVLQNESYTGSIVPAVMLAHKMNQAGLFEFVSLPSSDV